jgi:hypothetical protein
MGRAEGATERRQRIGVELDELVEPPALRLGLTE